jgi:uncharacterized membrane protein YsdA (DUF1294 family)/cold shock CspA family protein
MHYQGRITSWNDDRGFGFVTPNDGQARVFVHISSFTNPHRRPVINDVVTYRLGADLQGRPRGLEVAYLADQIDERSSTTHVVIAPSAAVLFLTLVFALVVAGHVSAAIFGLYLASSAIAFLAYATDKLAAEQGRWRTSESTLHLLGLVGGWPGALVAQQLFRHKTRKRSFQVTFWGTVVLNCGAFGWLLSPSGAKALESMLGATVTAG